MLKTLSLATAVGAMLITSVVPAEAATKHNRHYTRHYVRNNCRVSGNTGAAVGAIGGGLIGHSLGNKSTGNTLLGAGVGALAGHQIAKQNCKTRHGA